MSIYDDLIEINEGLERIQSNQRAKLNLIEAMTDVVVAAAFIVNSDRQSWWGSELEKSLLVLKSRM